MNVTLEEIVNHMRLIGNRAEAARNSDGATINRIRAENDIIFHNFMENIRNNASPEMREMMIPPEMRRDNNNR